MIYCDLDLFYEVCNAIDQGCQEQICFLSLILLSLFNIFVKENQNVLQ